MRIVRLFGVVLTIITAQLLLASPAGTQPPSKLTDHITDSSGVLTDSSRASVGSAIDRLSHDQHVQLWVVYVDNFNRFKPDNWADKTRAETGMGENDVLLAIATNTKLYAFVVPPKAQGPLTAAELNSLQSNKIEPAIGSKDWSGAAVAAADGLNPSATSAGKSNHTWRWIAIGVAVVLLVVVLLILRARRRRRAARQAGPIAAHPNLGGRVDSLGLALSTADARLRQIFDYIVRHRESVGAEAQARLDETKRYVAAAHSKEATNPAEAIADANRASTLAAHAQTLANADVVAAHRTPQRRGTA
jgi:uncharacterized membrane protein YgcG